MQYVLRNLRASGLISSARDRRSDPSGETSDAGPVPTWRLDDVGATATVAS